MKKSKTFRQAKSVVALAGVLCTILAVATSSPRRAESTVVPTYAYLGAGTGHNVHVIDDATKTRTTTIGPLSNDANWRCNRMTAYGTPDGTRIFQTATCQLNGVVINTLDNTYTRLGWSATAAAFSPDSQYVYVTSAYYRNAYKVSDGSNVWGVLSPCYRPYSTQWSIATSQDGSKLYIPYQGSCSNPAATYNQVDVLNTANGATVATITSPDMSAPSWTVAAPTGNRIYVGSNGKINVIDTTTDTVTMSWPIGTNSPVTVSRDGTRVYVATGTVIKVLDSSNGNEITSYAVSTGECGISLNPAGTHLYALTNGCQDLAFVRLSDSSISTLTLPAGQASRNIAWGTVTPAPNISLSASTVAATVGAPATSLYTVSNSGGPVASYSISPSLPSGLSFSASTGLISGTPNATQSSATYTITATNSGGVSTATLQLSVVNAPPTTTSTTIAITTTTTAPAVATAASSPAPTPNVVTNATTTTVTSSNLRSGDAAQNTTRRDATGTPEASDTIAATTTIAVTTTTLPAPDAPSVAAGDGVVVVDGQAVQTDVSRLDNSMIISGAGIEATVSGLSPDGAKIALDADGSLRLQQDDRIVVEASGYRSNEEVEVWLFSTPTRLGSVRTDGAGRFANNFDLPSGVNPGEHRLVLVGNTNTEQDIVLGIGLNVGAAIDAEAVSRWLIIVPVTLAVLLGLLIPTAWRRRRQTEES